MLVAVLGGLRLGLDLHINWIGRIAVWPTMGAVGAALLGLGGLRRGAAVRRPRGLDRGERRVRARRPARAPVPRLT